ncbi:putative late blight resistance protein homolog R1A-10 [Salvia splendens]|uniref:putative late blight resistance protein homolog R1A-10 n=1 Tax=Salvia splendens TaxID=180675 RepID=UPI001C262665|nr:putative late blight resistance protein homolog R1A-10 [Salvia splendens]
MAAYGALVSLMHIIDTLQKHPSPPISIHKNQVKSLTQIVTFLQEFLDTYNSPFSYSHEVDPLEHRIADAVYAAEDVIESHIVDQIDRRSTIVKDQYFYQNLQKVIEEMNLITKEVKEIIVEARLQQRHIVTMTSSSTVKDDVMVGFEEVFLEVLDKLTGDQLSRQIIPIMGMGGIGKTTLARNLFNNAAVKEHFDIRAWTTISQTYNVRETLREVYIQAIGHSCDRNENEKLSDLSENQLREKLYKFLCGKRYLVIMDDMWSVEVWEKIRFFFPSQKCGSRIIITTRLSNLSSQLNESYRVDIEFLDEASSWDLFCKTVFEKESCPFELENIGKAIVVKCKGLPLSIITIGGLLAKSDRTREYWEFIEQDLSSVIKSNDESCMKILWMSYIYLPNYLKPCFLYMANFEEDRSIRVSMLKKLWISEGFLKPRSGKSLEIIAQEYFKELVDRNLILVDRLGSTGNVKYCKIHDLYRNLCLEEVEKERFYHVIRNDPPRLNSRRRVALKSELLESLSHARSLLRDEPQIPHHLRLLRTFKAYDEDTTSGSYFLDNVFELVNSRYLAVRVHKESKFPTSIDLLWNLHTLTIHCWRYLIAPIEIWKLHQLRHLEFHEKGLILPDHPSGGVVMENLQTLKGVLNLFLNEEVVKRIPNVKKLHLIYNVQQMEEENCLSYLQCLSKLENFHCTTRNGCDDYLQRIRFPFSLKKLFIDASPDPELEDMLRKIGSLPLLEKFVLQNGFFKTGKWETVEGQFASLKFLRLEDCGGLDDWIVSDKSHFPFLQKLHLRNLGQLKEIPSEVGEIATLKSISLEYCSESAVVSAKRIVDEQEDLYGDELDLHVRALVRKKEKAVKNLANANFEVNVCLIPSKASLPLPFPTHAQTHQHPACSLQ